MESDHFPVSAAANIIGKFLLGTHKKTRTLVPDKSIGLRGRRASGDTLAVGRMRNVGYGPA